MNNFDDLFHAQGSQPYSGSQSFDKAAWAEKKKAERQAVYDLADTTAKSVCSDGGRFRSYLDVQARFDRYSVTNALLILAQMPQATQIKDYDGWKDNGASVRRHPQSISILEPGSEYTREDGKIGISYNVKKVFDVSQTTMRGKVQPAVRMDDRLLLKALIHRPPVPMQTVDDLPGNMGALYGHDQQVIFVRRGMDAPSIFRSVSMELAHAEIAATRTDYTREEAAFTAYSASYLLCRKYGVEAGGYDFSALPENLRESNPQAQRAALTEIRDTAEAISSRMSRALEQARQQRTNEQGR